MLCAILDSSYLFRTWWNNFKLILYISIHHSLPAGFAKEKALLRTLISRALSHGTLIYGAGSKKSSHMISWPLIFLIGIIGSRFLQIYPLVTQLWMCTCTWTPGVSCCGSNVPPCYICYDQPDRTKSGSFTETITCNIFWENI